MRTVIQHWDGDTKMAEHGPGLCGWCIEAGLSIADWFVPVAVETTNN